MNVTAKVKRIGRYWIGRDLLKEGYKPNDIFDTAEPELELPELFEPKRRSDVCWLLCPRCQEKTQVDRRPPSCNYCGWSEESLNLRNEIPCAA